MVGRRLPHPEEKPTYFTPSVDIAARVLLTLAGPESANASLAELARDLGANKTTCLRVVRTLQQHALLHYDESTQTYSLGTAAVTLAATGSTAIAAVSRIQPVLDDLTAKTGMTSVLACPTWPGEMTYLAVRDGTSRLRISVSVGQSYRVTESSGGLWYLAYLPSELRHEIISRIPAEKRRASLRDPEALDRKVEQMKGTGVLTSVNDFVAGVTTVTSPVFDRRGKFFGVVAIIGLSASDLSQSLESTAAMVKAGAQRASEA